MLKSKTRLLAGMVMFVSATSTQAQDATTNQMPNRATSSTSAQERVTPEGIEDIVVTARRRAENIQSVPIAVTALTDSVLRQKAISTPYDLVNSTPGIVGQAGSSSRNDVIYFIRGQGATFGSSPSVVTYFADVPQQTNSASGGSNITFFDLESVQVLKGPQGTLFGRSTTGGAVLVTPKRPSDELDGFAEASLGNYSARELTAAINVPIIGDRLAVRIAGNYSYHKGYSRSLTTGQDLDDRNRSAYRISILARPTDWLTNTLIFSDVNVDENGSSSVLWRYEPKGTARLVTNPETGVPQVVGSLLDTTPGGIGTGGLGFISVVGLCSALGGGTPDPACVSQRLGLINQVKAGLDAEWARLQAGGSRRRLPTDEELRIRSQVQQVINTTEINFGDLSFLGDTTFKNIFSTTRNLHSEAIRNIQGGVGTGIVYNDLDIRNGVVVDYGAGKNKWFDVWSEEAQLTGSFAGKHDWIIGFFKESQATNQYLNKPAVFKTLNGAFTVPAGLPGISTGYNDPYKFTQTGYFAQTTIDGEDFGLDGLQFTAGFRHSIVKNSLVAIPASLLPSGIIQTPNGVRTAAKLRQTANSYTFALDYKVVPGVLVYATTRKGFKQGGINIQSVAPAAAGNPNARPTFGPEKVTDYEVGVKADYDLGDIPVRTNLALFHSKFKGLHRSTSFFNGQTTSAQILNVAGLRSQGLELENIVKFGRNFEVNLSYAYLDSKFTDFPGAIIRPSTGEIVPRTETKVTGAPKHKIDVSGRYLIELGGDAGDVVLAANASYQSRMGISDDEIFATRTEEQAGYATVNARIDWNKVMGSPVDASVFVRNITNTLYRIGAGNLISAQLGTTTVIYGDPRTIGVSARVRFGASAN